MKNIKDTVKNNVNFFRKYEEFAYRVPSTIEMDTNYVLGQRLSTKGLSMFSVHNFWSDDIVEMSIFYNDIDALGLDREMNKIAKNSFDSVRYFQMAPYEAFVWSEGTNNDTRCYRFSRDHQDNFIQIKICKSDCWVVIESHLSGYKVPKSSIDDYKDHLEKVGFEGTQIDRNTEYFQWKEL